MTGYAISAIAGANGITNMSGISGSRGAGPVLPVPPVPEVKSSLQTKTVTAPGVSTPAEQTAQVLSNGDFSSLSFPSGVQGGAYSTEPQIDAFTSQRVWSA